MDIILNDIAKRYRWEWIFKRLSFHFQQGESYAVLGQNGAGKSTLMQLLAGFLSPSEGTLLYKNDNVAIAREDVFRYITLAAPYVGVLEEFTLLEVLKFQSQFKPYQQNLTPVQIVDILQLAKTATQKPLKYFSSGMKQRVKLALAILADTPLLLLDEPTITLDVQGAAWFQRLLATYRQPNRTLIIASNVEADFEQCTHRLDLLAFKK